MENARVRFLFTSCVVSENERVSAANEWVFWYVSTENPDLNPENYESKVVTAFSREKQIFGVTIFLFLRTSFPLLFLRCHHYLGL